MIEWKTGLVGVVMAAAILLSGALLLNIHAGNGMANTDGRIAHVYNIQTDCASECDSHSFAGVMHHG